MVQKLKRYKLSLCLKGHKNGVGLIQCPFITDNNGSYSLSKKSLNINNKLFRLCINVTVA